MSIHQSKGLEFPVVAVADLAKPFNTQDLRGDIIFDETFGLCPRIKPPHTGRRYPSLPHWLAQQHQRREQWGEELRLLYVALTRARDTLILTGTVSEKKWESLWTEPAAVTPQAIVAAKSYADWLGLWFAQNAGGAEAGGHRRGPAAFALAPWRMRRNWRTNRRTNRRKRNCRRWTTKPGGNFGKALAWKYPFAAATRRAAKSSVTALRRQAADELEGEAEPVFRPQLSAKRLATARPPTETEIRD